MRTTGGLAEQDGEEQWSFLTNYVMNTWECHGWSSKESWRYSFSSVCSSKMSSHKLAVRDLPVLMDDEAWVLLSFGKCSELYYTVGRPPFSCVPDDYTYCMLCFDDFKLLHEVCQLPRNGWTHKRGYPSGYYRVGTPSGIGYGKFEQRLQFFEQGSGARGSTGKSWCQSYQRAFFKVQPRVVVQQSIWFWTAMQGLSKNILKL